MRRSSSDRRASAVARDPAAREARRRARPPAALRLEPLTIEPPHTVARATERQKPRNRAVYAPAPLASRIESGWQTRQHKSRPGEPFGAQGEGTRAWPTSCRLPQLTPAAVANGLCEQIRKATAPLHAPARPRARQTAAAPAPAHPWSREAQTTHPPLPFLFAIRLLCSEPNPRTPSAGPPGARRSVTHTKALLGSFGVIAARVLSPGSLQTKVLPRRL